MGDDSNNLLSLDKRQSINELIKEKSQEIEDDSEYDTTATRKEIKDIDDIIE